MWLPPLCAVVHSLIIILSPHLEGDALRCAASEKERHNDSLIILMSLRIVTNRMWATSAHDDGGPCGGIENYRPDRRGLLVSSSKQETVAVLKGESEITAIRPRTRRIRQIRACLHIPSFSSSPPLCTITVLTVACLQMRKMQHQHSRFGAMAVEQLQSDTGSQK